MSAESQRRIVDFGRMDRSPFAGVQLRIDPEAPPNSFGLTDQHGRTRWFDVETGTPIERIALDDDGVPVDVLPDERGMVKTRELLEAISWRLTSDVLLLLCTWVITGRPTQAIGVTILYSIVSIVWYLPHNRWWRGRRGRRVATRMTQRRKK